MFAGPAGSLEWEVDNLKTAEAAVAHDANEIR
jgi:hypothetical protein